MPSNDPVPSEEKSIVPVGVVDVLGSVSDTVAVQDVASPGSNGFGEHAMLVLAERVLALTVVLRELVWWVASPQYVAVIVCCPRPTAVGV